MNGNDFFSICLFIYMAVALMKKGNITWKNPPAAGLEPIHYGVVKTTKTVNK